MSAARLRARKSLDEVSLATRVPVALLEAIERDAWEILPAMAYARGFVRAYAEAVTLDPQVPLSLLAAELARREGEVEAARVVGERRVRFDRLRFRIAYGAAIAVLIICTYWEGLIMAIPKYFGYKPFVP